MSGAPRTHRHDSSQSIHFLGLSLHNLALVYCIYPCRGLFSWHNNTYILAGLVRASALHYYSCSTTERTHTRTHNQCTQHSTAQSEREFLQVTQE